MQQKTLFKNRIYSPLAISAASLLAFEKENLGIKIADNESMLIEEKEGIQEEILKNAPTSYDGFFKLPRRNM